MNWGLIGKLIYEKKFFHSKHFSSSNLIIAIHSLNEILETFQPYQSQSFQVFAPKMPLNSPPLCVTLHVKNLCDIERELKVSKQLLCDCSLKKNRLRKEGKMTKCPHKDVVKMRPALSKIKAKSVIELEVTFKYDLLGQQEVHFMIM